MNTSGSGATGVGNTSGATTITGGTGGTSEPAVVISGQNGATAPNVTVGAYPLVPNGTGVLITGAGYDGGPDVYIASQNGKAAISVTNTGVTIISPAGTSGASINVSSTNNYGVAGQYNDGSVTNNFGNGNSTATGNIYNTIGSSAAGGGTVQNAIGGGEGSSTNSLGGLTRSGASSTNSIGSTVAGSTSTNSMGSGDGVSTNSIGNTNTGTTVSVTAGNTTSNTANGVSTTRLASGGGVGASNVGPGQTRADSGAVLSGATGYVASVDRNGKISVSDTPVLATESSAHMTISNGVGNTHGYFVNERQATMSGGVNSSSMTLNDYGATFSNSATGAPIQVHGVYDGTAQFDAVNVRQLYGAVAASMATVPNFTVEPGETGIGFGTAMMGSYPAIGMAFAKKNKNGSQINVGVAAAEHVPLAVRAGVGWVW